VSMLIAPLLIAPAVQASDIESVFEKSCAGRCILPFSFDSPHTQGCHAGGGNVLGGRTLRIEDLQAMQLADAESLFNIIYGGNTRMPGFGQDCEPRVLKHSPSTLIESSLLQGQCTFGPRLTDDEVRSLAEYVLDRAQKGWN